MIVAVMILDFFSKDIHSLKDKRHIVTSIKEKLRNKFNISIIESDYQDLRQKMQVTIALVSNSKIFAQKVFDQVEDFIFLNYPVRLIKIDRQFL